jgi:hypothetical protein
VTLSLLIHHQNRHHVVDVQELSGERLSGAVWQAHLDAQLLLGVADHGLAAFQHILEDAAYADLAAGAAAMLRPKEQTAAQRDTAAPAGAAAPDAPQPAAHTAPEASGATVADKRAQSLPGVDEQAGSAAGEKRQRDSPGSPRGMPKAARVDEVAGGSNRVAAPSAAVAPAALMSLGAAVSNVAKPLPGHPATACLADVEADLGPAALVASALAPGAAQPSREPAGRTGVTAQAQPGQSDAAAADYTAHAHRQNGAVEAAAPAHAGLALAVAQSQRDAAAPSLPVGATACTSAALQRILQSRFELLMRHVTSDMALWPPGSVLYAGALKRHHSP